MKNIKKSGLRTAGVILSALFLLTALPFSSLAEKGSASPLSLKKATSSDVEQVKEEASETEGEGAEKTAEGRSFPVKKATSSNVDKKESADRSERSEGSKRSIESEKTQAEHETIHVLPAKKASPSNVDKAEATPSDIPLPEQAAKAETTVITAQELDGAWTVDGVTTYLFDADMSGALLLPEHQYPFRYSMDSGELLLQFENERIGNAAFTPEITGDTLLLRQNEAAGSAVFRLKKTDP